MSTIAGISLFMSTFDGLYCINETAKFLRIVDLPKNDGCYDGQSVSPKCGRRIQTKQFAKEVTISEKR